MRMCRGSLPVRAAEADATLADAGGPGVRPRGSSSAVSVGEEDEVSGTGTGAPLGSPGAGGVDEPGVEGVVLGSVVGVDIPVRVECRRREWWWIWVEERWRSVRLFLLGRLLGLFAVC